MRKTFVIDNLPERAAHYQTGWAVVAIDVIRATTMAITAKSLGRSCYPVGSLDEAFLVAKNLDNPLLAGEIGGDMPDGFHMNNSPAELAERSDVTRPLVLLSSSGTRLIANASACDALYLGCFRNSASVARHLISTEHPRVVLLGAGSRGEPREEDQICCAWIGMRLQDSGYAPADEATIEAVRRWGKAQPTDCLSSRSVAYLKRTGQLSDLAFILGRIDDLDDTFMVQGDEVVMFACPADEEQRLDQRIRYSAITA